MPRFLNTSTGEFVWIHDARKARYAILSHTWSSAEDGGEQSYDDLRKLQASKRTHAKRLFRRARSTKDPMWRASVFSHPSLSPKIRDFCRVAREAGYELVWIDSCCIDKSSSAELSEAISSMFEWYKLADICYVYLAGVPDHEDPRAHASSFQASKWHRRGWTLQELIASKRVVFLTRTWQFLGTKIGLAGTLERATGVDFDILTDRASLHSASVARRMSWAARRETTRVEDEAYCLLGIFDVHMPVMYGEGRNAFRRLQEEIIHKIPDQSIFAWGANATTWSLKEAKIPRDALFNKPSLLAESPQDFWNARDITPMTPAQFALRLARQDHGLDAAPPLRCVFTPEGTRIDLLCIDLARLPSLSNALCRSHDDDEPCSDCIRLGRAHALALLRCQDDDGSLVALPLCLPTDNAEAKGGLAIAPYVSCGKFLHDAPFHSVRLTSTALRALRKEPVCQVRLTEVTLRRYNQNSTAPELLYVSDRWPPGAEDAATIKVDPECIASLHGVGFIISPAHCERWYSDSGDVHLTATVSLSCGAEEGSWQRGGQTAQVRLDLNLVEALPNGFNPWQWTVMDARCEAKNYIHTLTPDAKPTLAQVPLPALFPPCTP